MLASFACLDLDNFFDLAYSMPHEITAFTRLSGELACLLDKTFKELCPKRLCIALSAYLSLA